MNPVTYANWSAFAFLITGGVWGIFLVLLGVPKESAANLGVATIFAAMLMILAGVILNVYKNYYKSDSEDSE